jgi:DEAD/DEAH box helicase domain-containing protein
MPESLAVRAALQSSSLTRVREVLESFAARDRDGETLTAMRHFPAREAQWADYPSWLHQDLRAAYQSKKIDRLYTHQAAAAEAVHAGKNIVVVTPTASGKTLCYNLPVIHAILENPDTRAIYLFPTKALAQDQLAEIHDLNTRLENRFGVFTYDGDTPSDARKAIREKGHLVLTNPDMLHTGILPHHTRWTRLFENLKYIVLDELHTYRGVFGSHLGNVIRRLRRIANFYGSNPQFICCSATIANPGDLAEKLLETDVEVLNINGAPSAEKLFVFYNPPVVNKALGIRRSYINESCRVTQEFLKRDLQTMVFANSRLHTELMLTYLQQANPQPPGRSSTIRGYRGGYLPNERREIEHGLREGKVRGVVSTSALELGIDVGSLDTVVMAGYPGTIAATWQRAGRAGRRSGSSCAVFVASSAPLDQYIVRNPDYFFGNTPEHAFVQPDNLEILVNHLKCAAFELPIGPEERFGAVDVQDLCARLAEAGFLHRAGENYHWTQEAYPADTVSLRSVTSDNFIIVDLTGAPTVIGEVDFSSALTTVHEKAIYIHGGQQYHVEHLDFKERKAYVKGVDVDYYTDAIRYTQVRTLECAEESSVSEAHPENTCEPGGLPLRVVQAGAGGQFPGASSPASQASLPHIAARRSHGDVLVRSQVVGFKKLKFFTNENIGAGNLELPENEMHTTAYWITLERALLESLPFSISDRQSGMFGLLHALASVATLLLMCDRRDLGTAIGEKPPYPDTPDQASEAVQLRDRLPQNIKEFFEPNLYLYDAYPGGIGFSEPLFRAHHQLMLQSRELIRTCECAQGCPSCVGPAGDLTPHAKGAALAILAQLLSPAPSRATASPRANRVPPQQGAPA